jgi:serine/threonine-protein kinase
MAKTFAQLPGFTIGTRIGKGAAAVIYRATDRAGRPVALKHVVRRGPEDDRFIIQAENEFEVARRFDHPMLRQCYEIVRIRRWLKMSELFLTMELVEGERLEDRYPQRVERGFAEVVDIFHHIAEGLYAMHKTGYVHADMKPNNVLLTRDGHVKIIDFGQSCPIGHVKERVQGTADYIAPEQVERKPLDPRTDVFNLGATMYRVLTGIAYKTSIPIAAVAGVGTKKIELESRRGCDPPHELNPAVPLTLSRLVMECCEFEKDNRPWDMQKVMSRLDMVQHLLQRDAAGAPASQRPPA